MHASIRRYKKTATAELTRRVNQEFLPLISNAPGFVAYYAIDAGDGVWASVSVFDSREGAERSNRLAAEWIAKNLPSSTTGQPEITAGEVVAHSLAAHAVA
ncbi:MAG: hypothetical protein JWQ71_152 [Pedosphaera sp.]|nr:hypothetical protein [Pedosphaera sp.]